MKEVLKALRPVRRRIRRNRLLRGAAAGLAAGLGAAALLQGIAFLTPVPDRGVWAMAAAGAVLLLVSAGAVLRPVDYRSAAEAADGCGLEERIITALEGGEDDIRRLQREDALKALKQLDVKKIRPGSVKKSLGAAACCAVLLGVLLLIPSGQDGKAAEQKAFRKTLREGAEEIARAAEEDEASLPEERREELRRITGDLRNDLEHSRDEADAMLALDRADKRLEQLRQRTAGDAEAAGKGSAGTETADMPEAGNREGAGEKQGTAGKASGARANGQQGKQENGSSAATGPLKAQSAVSALKTRITPSAQQTSPNPSGSSGSGGGAGAGNSAGNSPGSGAGQGQGPSAQSGGGAGEGTTNLEQSGSAGQGGAHREGTRDPGLREAAYETIYDPERTGASFRDETTNQNRLGDDGSMQAEAGPGKGSLGGDVPWGEVLEEYADTEARSADRENLTTRERQWVTDYFTLLAEQDN